MPVIAVCGGLAVTVSLTGCGGKHPEAEPERALPIVTVSVMTVENLKRTATEEAVGTVRPKLSASVAAQVSGAIQQMLVVPGQSVKQGELLARIDAREIQARLDQAQPVRERAQKDTERYRTLLKQNAVTQQEFDATESRFRVAEAAVAEAQTQLGYTKVTAPFDGIITAKRADVGDLASPGRPLLDLESVSALRLEADVPEALISKVKLNDRLPVRVPAAKAFLQGTVAEIIPTADPASRTFRVKLDLPTTPDLRSGQFGRVAVPVVEVNAVRVPTSAVIVRGQMEIVFVVVDRRAQLRLVKTGKHLEKEVEVVSGLSPGDQIVVQGADQLFDGQPVEARK